MLEPTGNTQRGFVGSEPVTVVNPTMFRVPEVGSIAAACGLVEARHAVDPIAEKVPSAQFEHTDDEAALASTEYLPTVQRMHEAPPLVDW